CNISDTYYGTGDNDYDVHQLNMPHRDIVFKLEHFSGNDHQGQYHRKTRENRPSHEIRREYGGMPARYHRGSKVKGYNSVNRKYKRSSQTSKDHGNGFVTHPSFGSSIPSHTQSTIERFSYPGSSVSNGGEIRNQADKPEPHGNRE